MKKLIDGRGRLFGVISIVDIIVVLVVIVLGIGIYLRFFVKEETSVSATQERIAYTVQLKGVRMYAVESFKEGDRIFAEDGTYLGSVTKVDYTEATAPGTLVDGSYVLGRILDKYDVTLTVEGSGTIGGGVFYLSRVFPVNINSTRILHTKYVEFSATFMEVWQPEQ